MAPFVKPAKPFFLSSIWSYTIWPYIRPYRWACLAAFLALIFTALITLSFGQGLRLLVDQGFSGYSLNHTAFVFFSLILLLGAGTFARFFWVNWIGERVVADIRQALFKHLLHLPIPFFEGRGTGELQSQVIADTSMIQQFISGSLSGALRNALILVGGIVFLFLENTTLTLIAFATMPLVLFPLLIFGRRVKQLSSDNQQSVGQASAYLNESFQHIKTVQAFNHQALSGQHFTKKIQAALETAKERILQRAWLVSSVIVLVLGAVLFLLWLGGSWVLSGALTAGELTAFLFYAVLVAASIGTLSESYGEWQQVKGALQRVSDLLAVPSLGDPSEKTLPYSDKPLSVKITGLSFSYPKRSTEPVLKGLSLMLKPGESVGLVGLSGAGKSTLLELLLGFYSVEKGQLFLDDQDINTIPESDLRDQIAWVSQQPAIFSGTLWDNLSYADPNASRDAVLAAAESAHVAEFANKWPDAYNTLVGEGGMLLSGGQRQRVALARAILKHPRLLLLDEPTSALDAISEDHIQQALKAVMKNCTTIVIAHRLGTVKALSRIAVMHEGKIVAVGTHEELLRASPLYAELAELQFIG